MLCLKLKTSHMRKRTVLQRCGREEGLYFIVRVVIDDYCATGTNNDVAVNSEGGAVVKICIKKG